MSESREENDTRAFGEPFEKERLRDANIGMVEALKAVQGLDLCSALLGCDRVQNSVLILSMEGEGDLVGPSLESGDSDDVCINTVRIDARYNRSESKSALANIMRNLDMPDSQPQSRTTLSQLMENMIDSDDSN